MLTMYSFDQKTNLALLLPSLWDMDGNFSNQDKWRPLESILESWLTMIRKGKIVAMSKKDREALPRDRVAQDPWIKMPYNEIILSETIDSFNRLVQAVEARMPNTAATKEEESITGLLDDQALTAMQLAPSFIHDFLLRARRPNFQFIAPGLSTLDASNFARQPFWSSLTDPAFRDHEDYTHPPLLLFPSSHAYASPIVHTNPTTNSWTSLLQASLHIYKQAANIRGYIGGIPNAYHGISAHWAREAEKASTNPNHPFGYPFNKIHSYSAGLYIAPGDTEDEVKLLLPADVEGSGFARMSDGSEARLREDVYGIGFTPFKGWGNANLLDVLTHWLEMVESGAWEIDERGVVGGIEKWRDADVEATAGRYVLPMPRH
jgi:hypothetical protein